MIMDLIWIFEVVLEQLNLKHCTYFNQKPVYAQAYLCILLHSYIIVML